MGEAEALIDANYKREASVDVPSLHSTALQWVRQHHMKHLDRYFVESGDPHLAGRSIA